MQLLLFEFVSAMAPSMLLIRSDFVPLSQFIKTTELQRTKEIYFVIDDDAFCRNNTNGRVTFLDDRKQQGSGVDCDRGISKLELHVII